jgi:hypothetical protein
MDGVSKSLFRIEVGREISDYRDVLSPKKWSAAQHSASKHSTGQLDTVKLSAKQF